MFFNSKQKIFCKLDFNYIQIYRSAAAEIFQAKLKVTWHLLSCVDTSRLHNNVECNYYKLKEPILHLLWSLMDMFFGYNFPKPEPMWMKSGI